MRFDNSTGILWLVGGKKGPTTITTILPHILNMIVNLKYSEFFFFRLNKSQKNGLRVYVLPLLH